MAHPPMFSGGDKEYVENSLALKAYLNQPANDMSWGSNQLRSAQTPTTAVDGGRGNTSITAYSHQLEEVEKELECDSEERPGNHSKQ